MSPLGAPPDDLAGFPTRLLRRTRRLCRVHRAGLGPWWFSHDGSGRFDLAPPRGACYLAEDPLGAFVEVFRDIARLSEVTVNARRLSRLRVPGMVRLADCTLQAARAFGVTAAIHAGERYDLTRAWAEALAAAGFGGVRYLFSHDPSQRLIGVALFGPAGEAGWPVDSTGPIDAAVLEAARARLGIRVLPAPPMR